MTTALIRPVFAAILMTALPFAAQAEETGAAPAEPAPAEGAPGFSQLDADGDGRLDRAEFERASSWRFGILDKDADGIVSQAEFQAAATEGRERWAPIMFRRLDADSSGGLDTKEFAKRGENLFERADSDGDGALTLAELQEVQEQFLRR